MKDFRTYYSLPLVKDEVVNWVWDSKDSFVFQFEFHDKDKQQVLLDAINGDKLLEGEAVFRHDSGIISSDNEAKLILIRGWGRLTGTGGFNLEPEQAAHVQDTFAEFIVNQLNKR